MKRNFEQEYQQKLGLSNEGRTTILEIKEIYQTLLNQHADVSEKVTDAVDSNDYVKLSQLIVSRSQIQTAIIEIESKYKDVINTPVSMNNRIDKPLMVAAFTKEFKGEGSLLNANNTLNLFNQLAQIMVSEAASISIKTVNRGNQLSLQAAKFLIQKSSRGLAKLVDLVQVRS